MMENSTTFIACLSLVAFVVSVITELTKNISFLKKIPTILQVLLLSVLLWVILYFAACDTGYCVFTWYTLVGAIVAGFISAYVSSYGWEKLNEVKGKYFK